MMRWITLAVLLFTLLGCGSGSSSGSSAGGGTSGGGATGGTVNTEKLAGTPFEGLTTGDTIGWSDLRTGDFLTFSVDAVPIPVFLAFFTDAEESVIQEGIDLANTAVGFDVFEVVDTWDDGARVIYKVTAIGDADMGFDESFFTENPAITMGSSLYFGETTYGGRVVCDWQIELRSDGVDKWTVGHELGHAMGIDHFLIDYDEDTIGDLETDSIMQGDVFPDNPQLTDYNFMMEMQGDILMDHLGEGSDPDAE